MHVQKFNVSMSIVIIESTINVYTQSCNVQGDRETSLSETKKWYKLYNHKDHVNTTRTNTTHWERKKERR